MVSAKTLSICTHRYAKCIAKCTFFSGEQVSLNMHIRETTLWNLCYLWATNDLVFNLTTNTCFKEHSCVYNEAITNLMPTNMSFCVKTTNFYVYKNNRFYIITTFTFLSLDPYQLIDQSHSWYHHLFLFFSLGAVYVDPRCNSRVHLNTGWYRGEVFRLDKTPGRAYQPRERWTLQTRTTVSCKSKLLV